MYLARNIFFHLLDKYFLSSDYVSDTVLGPGDTVLKTQILALRIFHSKQISMECDVRCSEKTNRAGTREWQGQALFEKTIGKGLFGKLQLKRWGP